LIFIAPGFQLKGFSIERKKYLRFKRQNKSFRVLSGLQLLSLLFCWLERMPVGRTRKNRRSRGNCVDDVGCVQRRRLAFL